MLKTPILAIFRGIKPEHVENLALSCISAGIDTLEVTMNTPGAPGLIQSFNQCAQGKLIVGAGTILNESDFELAVQAGAAFIVTPVVNKEIIRNCFISQIPVFPGALTPTEVWDAWDAGATMVKVFPAGIFGPGYLKELHGPFNNVKLMAVGGVNTNNIADYFKNGASAVAVGGSIFSAERLQNKEYELITNDLKVLVSKSN